MGEKSGKPNLSLVRSTPLQRLRIMVVDDDRDAALTLKELLETEGHEVWPLYRASEAVQGLRHFRPDVVILDISLPDGSGFAIADEIRQMQGTTRPLMIALTGIYRQRQDRTFARTMGFDHFMTKPYEIQALLDLLKPLQSREQAAGG